ncbi:MAG: 4Fe-4S cluster-binding domain-containing protein, partial [Bacilli bacterium]|nr:4Fe-4S cluster-binding domain-containing protein [Bacilli bacterium]
MNKPSLVINVTDACNFHCVYCPPYGENLCRSNSEYDLNAIKTLIDVAAEEEVGLIRFTGGEPLLE